MEKWHLKTLSNIPHNIADKDIIWPTFRIQFDILNDYWPTWASNTDGACIDAGYIRIEQVILVYKHCMLMHTPHARACWNWSEMDNNERCRHTHRFKPEIVMNGKVDLHKLHDEYFSIQHIAPHRTSMRQQPFVFCGQCPNVGMWTCVIVYTVLVYGPCPRWAFFYFWW